MAKVDGRRNNGGNKNAGRKPKADEQKLIERLGKYEDKAHEKLEEAVGAGHSWAIKMYMEYRYGKPRETKDVNLTGDLPIFDL
ncbi:hypothetical protein D8Z79_025945 (plasmid) [Escherichia fergusonii]|uniref:Uncharacterized protein n=1 Tax=Lysinibacillus pakistanensis TaxID=759811 RepID=A0ABX6DH53_9BACI|nr:hypothetical protein [Escherichia fergusonii]QCZ35041.1 hypothetical protein D8Z79_025715 [Escherichia fergusonii]QCZ35086.1 hypothetical protein D8Z79_025945 [Escherichia fergusonii]QGG54096.1 hypothetical protein GDS87_24560 [Lysinibacillus pakistanensis]QGG54150.1 hypothetical protein GDS87_24840 [Lysinibacillus pakistanensis]